LNNETESRVAASKIEKEEEIENEPWGRRVRTRRVRKRKKERERGERGGRPVGRLVPRLPLVYPTSK
jgi:hypothetical protein